MSGDLPKNLDAVGYDPKVIASSDLRVVAALAFLQHLFDVVGSYGPPYDPRLLLTSTQKSILSQHGNTPSVRRPAGSFQLAKPNSTLSKATEPFDARSIGNGDDVSPIRKASEFFGHQTSNLRLLLMDKVIDSMVRKGGLEPPRPFGHQILSLARLPIPPLSHPRSIITLEHRGVSALRSGLGLQDYCPPAAMALH